MTMVEARNIYPNSIDIDYWPLDNIFTNIDGYLIPFIFDYVTPSDIQLFRRDPARYNQFQYIHDSDIVINIAYDFYSHLN